MIFPPTRRHRALFEALNQLQTKSLKSFHLRYLVHDIAHLSAVFCSLIIISSLRLTCYLTILELELKKSKF